METIDIILLVLLAIGAIKGYMKGLVVEVFSLVAFFIGLFFAVEFTTPVALEFFEDNPWFNVISIAVFLAIFLVIIIVINLVAKVIKKVLNMTFFGLFDSVLGAILGVVKWSLILSVVLWLFSSVGVTLPSSYVDDSFLFPLIAVVGPTLFEWAGELLPFFKDIFDSMDKFDRKGRLA
ncbi:MAG: CvpA family protein [Cyclobacteriaceae bacterium]